MTGRDTAITLDDVDGLHTLFAERVRRTPAAVAYRFYDAASGSWQQRTWWDTAEQVARWQQALQAEGLQPGDRVAIMSANRWEWVICDQAALGLGLVVVPVYTNDRPDNLAWILKDSGARLLLLENAEQWAVVSGVLEQLSGLERVVSINPLEYSDGRARCLDDWLPMEKAVLQSRDHAPDELATIVYTSGTTGQPKGVMLSHRNLLWNVSAAAPCYPVGETDLFLSFLPLSHTFERTVGYYLPMACGATVAYNREIPLLAEDLQIVRPTLLIAVPRIFERVYRRLMDKLSGEPALRQKLFRLAVRLGWRRYRYDQGRAGWGWGLLLQPLLDRLVGAKVRARLGGRLRFAVSGGAALSPEIAQTFIGLGVIILQGYGLTETSPVIAGNRLEDNDPATVGTPLPGVAVRMGDQDELLTRSPSVMLGYWHNPEATTQILDADGWLHTGDQVAIDAEGHIRITGRLKEIIVLSTGEKISPTDMENAIGLDPLFAQALVVGEGKPFLGALLVPEHETYMALLHEMGLDPQRPGIDQIENVQQVLLERVRERLAGFPGYAQVYRLAVVRDAWDVDSGLLTPTLKPRRTRILERHQDKLDLLYGGH